MREYHGQFVASNVLQREIQSWNINIELIQLYMNLIVAICEEETNLLWAILYATQQIPLAKEVVIGDEEAKNRTLEDGERFGMGLLQREKKRAEARLAVLMRIEYSWILEYCLNKFRITHTLGFI